MGLRATPCKMQETPAKSPVTPQGCMCSDFAEPNPAVTFV